ncbi:MAG: VCBS repeat-containing protein [Deltaproteobacteria bacterium]|nr:VCBS repeat-containing protein [Deltaproteobacteria bacterium]
MNNITRALIRIASLCLAIALFSPPLALAGNRTLALFPLAIYAKEPKDYLRKGLKAMFVSRLSDGSLEVVTDEKFRSLLENEEIQGKLSSQRIKEIAKELQVDYAVYGSVTAIGAGYSLDLTLLDLTKTPAKKHRVSRAMSEDQFIPDIAKVAERFRAIIEGRTISAEHQPLPHGQAGESQRTSGPFVRLDQGAGYAPQTESGLFREAPRPRGFQPSGMVPLHMTVVSFDAGDLTGDGRTNLVAISRSEMRIYEEAGQTYRTRDRLKAATGEDFLKVSIGDVDGNGKAEIYLVSFYGGRAKTTAFEWDGKFRRLFRKAGHLHVVSGFKGSGPLLLYQDSRIGKLFWGGISVMDYAGKNNLQVVRHLPKLKDARFYTIMAYDINKDGSPEFIGLGDGNVLTMWDNGGKVLWSDNKGIGGTNNSLRVGDFPMPEYNPWVYINSRMVRADIDGDGKKELIAVKNIGLSEHMETLNVYTESQLVAYSFEGAALKRGWDTRKIPYCVVDIQVRGKTLFIAGQKGRLSKVGKGYSRIMWFDLGTQQ